MRKKWRSRKSDKRAEEIGKRVVQHIGESLPRWVEGLRFETGEDWVGDPALWIWVELEDEAARRDFNRKINLVQGQIQEAIRVLDIGIWPFIRFRTVSEVKALRKAGRA